MTIRVPCGVWCVIVLCLPCIAGCGQEGPRRYHISGKVTFKGQPVPEGNISFEPVSSEIGGGFAFVREGKFDTSEEGRGHLGGEHRVRITGHTGVLIDPNNPDSGTVALFQPYETTLDLPQGSSEQEFEVPEDPAP